MRIARGNHGGAGRGQGRKPGSTGRELKKKISLCAYPSDIEKIKSRGLKLQSLLDDAIKNVLVTDD